MDRNLWYQEFQQNRTWWIERVKSIFKLIMKSPVSNSCCRSSLAESEYCMNSRWTWHYTHSSPPERCSLLKTSSIDFVNWLRQFWTWSSDQISDIQHAVTYWLYAICITCILNGMSGNSKPEGSGRHRQTGDAHTHTQDCVWILILQGIEERMAQLCMRVNCMHTGYGCECGSIWRYELRLESVTDLYTLIGRSECNHRTLCETVTLEHIQYTQWDT